MTNGTIYGSNETNQTLRNTATANNNRGNALGVYSSAIARYGSGSSWTLFNSSTYEYFIENTIEVKNGVLQP